MIMSLEACRQQLALTLARLEREEIIDFNGHFSARLARRPRPDDQCR